QFWLCHHENGHRNWVVIFQQQPEPINRLIISVKIICLVFPFAAVPLSPAEFISSRKTLHKQSITHHNRYTI
ncbi:MAG: hypothetical protein V6Z82_03905, partial [Flavobacteriales bacterium]